MDETIGAQPGMRRRDLPDPAGAGEDSDLLARIRAEIGAGGPMPFARFMDLAINDPDGGYYRAAVARPGRGRRLRDRPRAPSDLRPDPRPGRAGPPDPPGAHPTHTRPLLECACCGTLAPGAPTR